MEIEKINLLAKELLKHGMAGSSNEAYKKAETMLRKEETKGKDEAKEQENAALREIGFRINSIQKEVNALQNDMANLKSEISAVKNRLESVMLRINEQREVKNIAVGEKKDKQAQHPHNDLSIEKIFYFGNKK